MATFHSLTIANVGAETSDAVTITFTTPDALRNDYVFRPGQYLTLKAHLGGGELHRYYSIRRSRSPPEVSVTVKTIDDRRFSRYAQQDIQQGTMLGVMVPQGHFDYQPQVGREAEYLAIVARSGTTPMMAITEATLMTEPASQLTLIYGDHSSHRMMFRQALADLKNHYPQRLQVVHLFGQELMDSDLLQDRIDGDRLRALGKNSPNSGRFDDAFIYGLSAMMDEAEVALRELGIAEKPVHFEHFSTPGISVKYATGIQAEGRTVALHQDGRDHLIPLSAEGDSVLDTVLRQGADLPLACKGGVCATCKYKMVSGKMAMTVNYSLEADESTASHAPSRQALPTGGDVMVDLDTRGMT